MVSNVRTMITIAAKYALEEGRLLYIISGNDSAASVRLCQDLDLADIPYARLYNQVDIPPGDIAIIDPNTEKVILSKKGFGSPQRPHRPHVTPGAPVRSRLFATRVSSPRPPPL